ncbi:MAG: MFS transporter, partial [Acidimicrobiales bacterium]|nr:MFS transporter [Acidimicrobiales bacterium]
MPQSDAPVHARRVGSVRWSAALSALVVGLNLAVMNVAFADLRASFPDTPLTTLGWVVSAYTIVFGAILVPAGRLADRLGRRSVFFTGLVVFATGSILAGSAPWLWMLIAGRAVQGIGAACITPASLALLIDASPVSERAAATSFYSGVSSIGAASGPSIGALVVEASSWRLAFFLGLPVLVVSWLLGRRSLPRSVRISDAELPDLLGAALVVLAMTAVSFGIVQSRTWGWGDARVWGSFGVAAIVAPLFVRRCRRHPSPVMAVELFAKRSFAGANLAALFFGCATGGIALVNVLFLRDVWGYSLVGAGFGALPSSLTAMAAAPFVGRMGVRFGERAVGVPGAACIVTALLWFRFVVDADANYWLHWLPAACLLGLGIAAAFPMIAVLVVRGIGSGDLSLATATNRTSLQLGNAIGIAAAVALLGADTSAAAIGHFRLAWAVLAVLGT